MTDFLFPLPGRGNHAARVSVLQGSARDRKSNPPFGSWMVPPKNFESPFSVQRTWHSQQREVNEGVVQRFADPSHVRCERDSDI